MARATSFQTLRVTNLLQIASIGLLTMVGFAHAADQPFDVVVTADSTSVMAGANSIGEIPKGTRLTVSQTNGDWYLIDLRNANPPQQGWIRKSDVEAAPAQATAAQQEESREEDRLFQECKKLRGEGKTAEAAAVADKMLDLERKLAGDNKAELADYIEYASGLHEDLYDYSVARKLREESLAIRTSLLGQEHWKVTDARLILADVNLFAGLNSDDRAALAHCHDLESSVRALLDKHDYAAALPLAKESLSTRTRILGPKHRLTAAADSWLGYVYENLGQYETAESLYKKMRQINGEVFGETHPEYASAVNNLGRLYYLHHDYVKAEPMFRKSLAIRKVVLGPKDIYYRDTELSLSNTLDKFAVVDVAQEKWDAAHQVLSEMVRLQTELYGENGWQVNDARSALPYIDRLATLKSEDRKAVAHCDDLVKRLIELHEKKDFNAALPLAKEMLATRSRLLGEKQRRTAQAWSWLGSIYRDLHQYNDAEAAFRHALQIEKEILGESHPEYASELQNLGNLYSWEGENAKSEPLFRQAAAIRKTDLGQDSSLYRASATDLATTLDNMAVAATKHEDWDSARKEREEGLRLRTELFGEGSWQATNARLELADVELSTSLKPEDRKALDHCNELYDQVQALRSKADFNAALPLAKEALSIRTRLLGPKNHLTAFSCSWLATVYKDIGQYKNAESLFQQSMDIQALASGKTHPEYAKSVSNLAFLYKAIGDYVRAERLQRQAVDIYKVALGEKNADYATNLYNLASLYEAMSDYVRAAPLYLQALKIRKEVLGENSLDYAQSLSQLGLFSSLTGDYASAETLLRRALEIRKKVQGENHPNYGDSLNSLGLLYFTMHDYAKAEPCFRQAQQIYKQTLGEHNSNYATTLSNLALLYDATGDLAHAEPICRQTIAIYKERFGPRNPLYASALGNLAVILDDLNRPLEAVGPAAEAINLTRAQLDATADVQSERQQLLMNQVLRGYLDDFLTITDDAKSAGDVVYPAVLAWKGAVTARQQAIRRMRQANRKDLDPHTAELYEQLAAKSAALASLSRSNPDAADAEAYRTRLDRLHSEVESLQEQLASGSSSFRHEMQQRSLKPADLQRSLPADTVLVDFLEYNHFSRRTAKAKKSIMQWRLAAFILPPKGPIERVELGPTESINTQVDLWRRTFGRTQSHSLQDPGAELRALVWDKIEPYIKDAKIILISPDGETARFPWAALPGKRPGAYLIDDTAIAVVPIPGLLPEMLEKPKTAAPNESASMLLVGGVEFGADPGRIDQVALDRTAARGGAFYQWQPLPGTAAEVAGVKTVFDHRFGPATPIELTGAAATKSAVREQMSKCRYLHFSTHGFFAPPEVKSAAAADPAANKSTVQKAGSRPEIVGFHPDLLSGLVLAGANRPMEEGKEDGILTALEVSGLDLSDVDLATLSACETGLGKSAGGEGVLGLQRAFQSAGAKSVVASLWKVPDRPTQVLMVRFYDNLWNKKLSKLESLLEAQRWLLREGAKQPELIRGRGLEIEPEPGADSLLSGRLSPRYWAAFELSGDWR